jgi:endonuclease/exonuclease/phosphatase (EEP) superfamily protein YafD
MAGNMSPASATARPSILSALTRVVVSLTAAAAVVAVALTLAGFAARFWWRFEQACHFRVQYFWLLLFAALVLWAARRPRLAGFSLFAALLNALTIVPIYWPASAHDAGTRELRVLSFNVLTNNSKRDQVIEYLRQQKADLVLLVEVDDAWAKALEKLADLYPHRHLVPRDDNFGIALLSRLPWRDIQTLNVGKANVPTIVAEFGNEESSFVFIGTHPLPPASKLLAQLRNQQLAELANLVREQQKPTVLTGDLNTTNFSPYFRDLLAAANLRDTRQGRGIQASWGPLPLFEIPIDHCLVSRNIAILNRRLGPHLGSDHRPIIVHLRLADQDRTTE